MFNLAKIFLNESPTLTAYIFEASYNASDKQAKKI